MKTMMLLAAAAGWAVLAGHAQQGSKPAAAAPETTMDGAKAPAKPAPKAKKKTKAAVAEHKVKASEYGKKARCPVSGEEFTVDEKTKAVAYKGKVYYFCCPECAPAFKKDPAKYAK